MKKVYAILLLIVLNCVAMRAQSLYFPPLSGNSWDTLAPQRFGWCQPRIDSLYNYLQLKHSKSFILLKNGKIVLEKYFGTYTADSLFYWASASKSLASFITGVAQQKGFINITNPVNQYLGAGWTNEAAIKESLITVKDLLKMTSGMEDNPPPPCDNEDTAKACLTYKVDAGPRWAYHTGAYKKVQSVVSAATGVNYNLITNNWIEAHTGMSGAWINQTYYSKARDMARFGLLTLNKGIWSADTLLKDSLYFKAMVATSQTMNPSYGYLWWLNGKSTYKNPGLQVDFTGPLIPNAPMDLFAALGKDDQKIYVAPGEDLVVIRQGNSADGVTFALSTFDNTLWDYINKLGCVYTSVTGINSENIAISPNPATEHIHIQSPVQVESAAIINLVGVKKNVALTNNAINIAAFETGIYTLQLNFVNGQTLYKRVVVER